MRIGCHLWEPGPPINQLDRLQKYGGTVLQTFIGEMTQFFPHDYCDEDLAAFKARKERENIFVAVHGPFVVNVANSKKWSLGVKSIIKHLEVAEKMGADVLVFHPGSVKDETPEQGVYHLVKAINKILDTVPGKCKLLFENTCGGGTTAGKLDDLVKVADQVANPRFGICLDTAHAWADGWAFQDILEVVKDWHKLIMLCHLNMPEPSVAPDSHRDRHSLPWKQGAVDETWMHKVALALAERNIPMVMEASVASYEENFDALDRWEYERSRSEGKT